MSESRITIGDLAELVMRWNDSGMHAHDDFYNAEQEARCPRCIAYNDMMETTKRILEMKRNGQGFAIVNPPAVRPEFPIIWEEFDND